MQQAEVPTGLAEMPPRPGLAATLAGLDLARVPDRLTLTVLQAQYRQVAHEQARLLQAIVEMGRALRCPIPTTRSCGRCTGWRGCGRSRNGRRGALGRTHPHRGRGGPRARPRRHGGHPAAGGARRAVGGAIDLPKTRVFADLRHRSDTARRRFHRAVRDRAVIGYLRPDGTVTVSATGLPAGEAAVACERLDVLAAAAQRAGHPGRAAQIQTDLFLGMLDGSFHHLTEA